MSTTPLSVQGITPGQLLSAAGTAAYRKGMEYHQQNRVDIERWDSSHVTLRVHGSATQPYRVDIDRNAAGQYEFSCDCPSADGYAPCKHVVAAVLELRSHVSKAPRLAWEYTLNVALEAANASVRKSGSSSNSIARAAILMFSLQKRSSYWSPHLYSLPISRFASDPAAEEGDPAAIAAIIARERLSAQATRVKTIGATAARFINLNDDERRAATMAASMASQYGYGYYSYGMPDIIAQILPLLGPRSAVFTGTESDPLRTHISVQTKPATGRAALRLRNGREGGIILDPVVLRPQTASDSETRTEATKEEIVSLAVGKPEFLAKEPVPYILSNNTLYSLAEAPSAAFYPLVEGGEIRVPLDSRSRFIERYLTPFAQTMPLIGNAVVIEDLDAETTFQPRLYLSEDGSGGPAAGRAGVRSLRAQLRFGYGDVEVEFDPALPHETIRQKIVELDVAAVAESPDAIPEPQSGAAAAKPAAPKPALARMSIADLKKKPMALAKPAVATAPPAKKVVSAALYRVHRKSDAERLAYESLGDYGLKRDTHAGEPGWFTLRARTDVVDFLMRWAPKLAEAGFAIYGEESLTQARVNRNKPTLSLRVSSGIDWFDVEADVQFGETAASLKEVRKAVKRRERYVKLADGSIGLIPDDWLEKYRHLFALSEETEDGLRLSSHHALLLDQAIEDAEGGAHKADEEFARRKKRLRDGFASIVPHDLPPGLNATLYPYQKAGFDWLHFLHEYGFGGCLADDMGLGKTITALSFLLSLRRSLKDGGEGDAPHATTPDLVVVPRSLLFNWEREAQKFTPDLKILVYADGSRPREAAALDGYDLILTTYGILLRDIEMLRDYPFHYALLDEAQAIKNPLSQTSRASRLLGAEHKLTLTGTPVENSALELWSQFAFLNPGLLGSLEGFKTEFAGAIERKGDQQAADTLRSLIQPFLLRRTKDQVAPELPQRTERIRLTDMDTAQAKVYARVRDYYRDQVLGLVDEKTGLTPGSAQMKILEGLLRLRQICNHPRLVEPEFKGDSAKFEAILDTLETLRAEGHKALVFSQFVQMLTLLRDALDARGIPYVYLDGRTRDRQARVDQFQNEPDLPFFLISLKAGGVGLNLTAADYVLHVDPWWNPAVEQQATDRAHRIGQDKPVFVDKFIVKDTVEEKILLLQERKRNLANQLISTEESFFKSLTRQDIEALFT